MWEKLRFIYDDLRRRHRVYIITIMSIFTEVYIATYIIPILPDIVTWLGYKEEDKGIYTGIIAAMFNSGIGAGGFVWGLVSDKYGRRKILIICMILNGLLCFLTGLCRSLAAIMIVRFLTGLTNGTVQTIKAFLFDFSDDSNHAFSMGLVSVVWSVGFGLSQLISSKLASPAEKYDVGRNFTFLSVYPYLMPSVIGACLAMMSGLIITCIFTQDMDNVSNHPTDNSSTNGDRIELETNQSRQQRELKQKEKLKYGTDNRTSHGIGDNIEANSVEDLSSESSQSAETDDIPSGIDTNTFNLVDEFYDYNEERKLTRKEAGCFCSICVTIYTCIKLPIFYLLSILKDGVVILALAVTGLFAFALYGYTDILTVWCSTVDNLGGLAMSSTDIGYIALVTSIPSTIIMLFVLPLSAKKLGTIATYIMFSILTTALMSLLPLIRYIQETRWGLLIATMMLIRVVTSICFTATDVIVNNSVPVDQIGSINGIKQSVTSFAASVGPLTGGGLFTWIVGYGDIDAPLDVSFSFVFLGFVFWISTICCYFIPRRLNYTRGPRDDQDAHPIQCASTSHLTETRPFR